MLRQLTVIGFILLGLIFLIVAFLMAADRMPRYNQWGDVLTLLGAFLMFGMAFMELRDIRQEQEGNRISQLLHQRELHRRSIGNVHQNRW